MSIRSILYAVVGAIADLVTKLTTFSFWKYTGTQTDTYLPASGNITWTGSRFLRSSVIYKATGSTYVREYLLSTDGSTWSTWTPSGLSFTDNATHYLASDGAGVVIALKYVNTGWVVYRSTDHGATFASVTTLDAKFIPFGFKYENGTFLICGYGGVGDAYGAYNYYSTNGAAWTIWKYTTDSSNSTNGVYCYDIFYDKSRSMWLAVCVYTNSTGYNTMRVYSGAALGSTFSRLTGFDTATSSTFGTTSSTSYSYYDFCVVSGKYVMVIGNAAGTLREVISSDGGASWSIQANIATQYGTTGTDISFRFVHSSSPDKESVGMLVGFVKSGVVSTLKYMSTSNFTSFSVSGSWDIPGDTYSSYSGPYRLLPCNVIDGSNMFRVSFSKELCCAVANFSSFVNGGISIYMRSNLSKIS